jgi:hypothetical protein
MEFQVTQEYLGQGTHLVYLAPLFKECLDSDTWSNGKGSTVAKVIDGSLDNHTLNGMAGVSNIGNDINWTGHPFAQANWYSVGKIKLGLYLFLLNKLPDEWLRMTFSNDLSFIKDVKKNDAIFKRDNGKLYESNRPAPYYGNRPPLRSGPLGQQFTKGRLEPCLLSQSRFSLVLGLTVLPLVAMHWSNTKPGRQNYGRPGWLR